MVASEKLQLFVSILHCTLFMLSYSETQKLNSYLVFVAQTLGNSLSDWLTVHYNQNKFMAIYFLTYPWQCSWQSSYVRILKYSCSISNCYIFNTQFWQLTDNAGRGESLRWNYKQPSKVGHSDVNVPKLLLWTLTISKTWTFSFLKKEKNTNIRLFPWVYSVDFPNI